MNRISQYREMWVLVFFDLPTNTKREIKSASDFRKRLISDGFTMFQFSVYLRHCASAESADVHIKRTRAILPEMGKVSILRITDKQFGNMEIYNAKKSDVVEETYIQLELF